VKGWFSYEREFVQLKGFFFLDEGGSDWQAPQVLGVKMFNLAKLCRVTVLSVTSWSSDSLPVTGARGEVERELL